ncbi:type IA DNA topoisomerase [Chryseobacterium sp. ISL-6]|uniref:topoisomerase C-terminal repeat-containing protein n=1 Tax=Chryseobacterium sp. ISL-6 TaxID=2819143 RepID=UPI0020360E92|nr:type IA DNA topoisomerase [Chryseobacterium sp. ISL-6]
MTAEWEIALDRIEKGELNKTQFINDIQQYTTEITNELLSLHIPQENTPQLKCPKCQQHNLIIKDKIVKCTDEQCNWILFRIICVVQLSIKDFTLLLTQNKTSLIKNMKSKNGKKFDAYLALDDKLNLIFKFC